MQGDALGCGPGDALGCGQAMRDTDLQMSPTSIGRRGTAWWMETGGFRGSLSYFIPVSLRKITGLSLGE